MKQIKGKARYAFNTAITEEEQRDVEVITRSGVKKVDILRAGIKLLRSKTNEQ